MATRIGILSAFVSVDPLVGVLFNGAHAPGWFVHLQLWIAPTKSAARAVKLCQVYCPQGLRGIFLKGHLCHSHLIKHSEQS